MHPSNLSAVIVAAMVVVTAFASAPVAAAEHELAVETDAASEVTDTAATLNGNLTALGDADNATVWFEYWREGDSANATLTPTENLSAPASFDHEAVGLDNETTYVFVAYAQTDDALVNGSEVTFTTGEQADDGPSWSDGPFGRLVATKVKALLDGSPDGPFGQLIADFVTANNPGAEKRSDNANPGGNGDGPPDHAGPGDKDNGPPDHTKGNPDADDAESTDDEDDKDEEDGDD